MKTTMAEPAISFQCPYCGFWQFMNYTLESDKVDGVACLSDVVACEKCNEEVKVVERH